MRFSFLIITIILILTSCGKGDEAEAIDSLLGKWYVLETYYEEGRRVELGSIPDTSNKQIDKGGNFNFESESTVSFEYTINDEQIIGMNKKWSFEVQSRKNGFTNSNAYFITIEDKRFEVMFGDGTSDSHIEAKNACISYTDNLDRIGPYFSYQLMIKKE